MNAICISIIIPVYNAEKYLEECVQSILKQSYGYFEVLLINDGSTDNSLAICEQLMGLDKRIHVFHKENGGVTSARKMGWQKSKGNYLFFADADDCLAENCLLILMDYVKTGNYDIVNGSFESFPIHKAWVHKRIGEMNSQQYLESFLHNETFGTVYPSLYKKDLLKDSTFDLVASFQIGEDVLMNIELASRIKKVLNIKDIIYYYRQNEGSAMNNYILHPEYIYRYFRLKRKLLTNGLNSNYIDEYSLLFEETIQLLNAYYMKEIDSSKIFYNQLCSMSNLCDWNNYKLSLKNSIDLEGIKHGYNYSICLKMIYQIIVYSKSFFIASENKNKKIIF